MADDPLDELSHEEKERLAELVKGGTSRRDLLKAGGALGVGAILGGGGYAASTQNAKADASTSDSDGNVGTPSNLVDVFAEGIAGGGNQIDVGDSLVPNTNASYDLGSSSNTWNNGHFGSVSTDQATITYAEVTAASRGTISQWGPKAMDHKGTPPLPTSFTKSSDNPIITGNASTNNQAGYPTIFHAGRYLSNPEDEWYLYWAGHDTGGINLHTAPDIEGPWSAYSGNPLFDETDVSMDIDVSSPCVIYDTTAGECRMYWHGEDDSVSPNQQPTLLSASSDGLSWTERGVCLDTPRNGNWDDNERTYAVVTRIGKQYVALYDGRDQLTNNKGLGVAWSPDGTPGTWRTRPDPLFYNDYIDHVTSYNPQTDQQGPTPALLQWGGSWWVLLSVGEISSREIIAVRWDRTDQRSAPATTVLTATDTWEDGSIEAPRPYFHDGRLYIFYNSIPSDSERSIGYAYYDLEGYT